MEVMDIVIEEPVNKFANKLYQGQRWRYPSMTDVKFINDEYIVAAHRYGCKVYVIRLHNAALGFIYLIYEQIIVVSRFIIKSIILRSMHIRILLFTIECVLYVLHDLDQR